MQKEVAQIFNNGIFEIPNYQRDYAWETKNVEDLWEDLLEAEQAKNDEMGHFLGTIVVAKNPQDSNVYDIIDGQQRATTLFMLRYALHYKTQDTNWGLNNFLDKNRNPRLRVIEQNREFFSKILQQAEKGVLNSALEQEIKTDGQRKLYEVFKSIWSYVSNLDNQRAETLLNVLEKMVLMWLEEKDSGRAIRMFQTVNDRGMPLLILDKLKSLLILYSNKYCEGKLDETINERFGEIFVIITEIRKHPLSASLADRDFSKEIEARIFNYHALGQKEIGHYSYGADESYKKLKDLLKNKVKDLQNLPNEMNRKQKLQDLHDWLNHYSKDLLEFFKAFLEIAKMTENNIESFKLLYILRINPYFYSSLVRLKMNNILDDECLRLYAQAEICFYGLGSANDSSAYKLYQFVDNKDTLKTNIIDMCKKCSKGGYKNINSFIDEVAINNFDWKKYFHYMFLTYHSKNMDIKTFEKLLGGKVYSMSIEHIVPQNAIENGSLQQYGFKDREEFDVLKNTFGNLLVLESNLNSANKDYGLAKKQENYRNSQIPYNVEFANREDFLSFNKENIKQENENFTQWARDFFKDFLE
ncbi:DUF262 domain-containing protein [Helicobacter apodemus]|uniref:DUF262 domain-containing protein n=1 Tax=Helicobacter apodemus TaxID=135569 RepID=A0A2U8FCZ9_9HELI|nr:DUF262 domain-containing protein [Helicobacter apodemus]AWI34092.1 hypothetical protein CDV25_04365 [Helicobacter apodemus]